MTEARYAFAGMTLRSRVVAAALGAACAQLIGDLLFVIYLVSWLAWKIRFGAAPTVIVGVFLAGPVPVGAVLGWIYPRPVRLAGRYLQDWLARRRLL